MSNQVRSGDFPQMASPMREPIYPSTSQSPLADLARTTKDQASVIMSLIHLLEDKTLEVERLKLELPVESDSKYKDMLSYLSDQEVGDQEKLIDFVEEFERVLNPDRPAALGLDVTTLKPLMKLYRQLPEWVRSQESPSSQSFQALKEQERALQAESYKSTGKYDQDLERIESPTGMSRKSERLVADKSGSFAQQLSGFGVFDMGHTATCQCDQCVYIRAKRVSIR